MQRRDCLRLLSALGAAALPIRARAAAPVTLKFWTFLNLQETDPRGHVVNEIVRSFNASQSNYHVEPQSIDYARIDNSVIQATAAGQGPDVVNVYSDMAARHAAAHTLMPLNPYLEKTAAADQSGFVVPLKELMFNGQLLTLPWEARVWLLWYRTDLLAQARLPVPETLDAMGMAGGKISNEHLMGFAFGASQAGLGAGVYQTLTPLLWGAGGDLLDSKGNAAFDSPAGVKVLAFLHDLVAKYKAMKPTVVSLADYDVMASFKAGTVGMAVLGSYLVTAARSGSAVGQSLRTAAVPGWSDGTPSPARLAAQCLSIGASSTHAEGAWAFIQYYTSAESQIAFAKAGVMPSREGSYSNRFFSDTDQGKEMMGWKTYAVQHGRFEALPQDFTQLSEDLVQAVQQVLLHDADPAQVLKVAAQQYDSHRSG